MYFVKNKNKGKKSILCEYFEGKGDNIIVFILHCFAIKYFRICISEHQDGVLTRIVC